MSIDHPTQVDPTEEGKFHEDVESVPSDGPARPIQADKLNRALSARQVQMIAIGGTIGTGLFLGTGKSLATGGPASVLIAYLIVGGIVFVTMLSLGEMAAYIPVAGSFCTFAGWVMDVRTILPLSLSLIFLGLSVGALSTMHLASL